MTSIVASATSAAILACFDGRAGREYPDPGHVEDPRHRIQHDLAAADARIVALEIGDVSRLVVVDLSANRRGEAGEVVRFRGRRRDPGAFDMDDMFRRRVAAVHQVRQVGGRAEGEDLRTAPVLQHEAPRLALDAPRNGNGAAQDRRDLVGAGQWRWKARRRERLRPTARKPTLGLVDHGDHRLVGFTRVLRIGERAVLEQNHAVAARPRPERLVAGLRQQETRHHIRHDDRVREKFSDQRLALGLVGQRHDSVGVSVVDVLVGEVGVQDRLDRRVRGVRVHQLPPLEPDHLLVGQRLRSFTSACRGFNRTAGSPARLDGPHVPTAALDAEHLDFVAVGVRDQSSSPTCFRRHEAPGQDRCPEGAWCTRGSRGLLHGRRGRISPRSPRLPLHPISTASKRLSG